MDEWTEREDREADRRCPDKCPIPGCTRVAMEAIQLVYFIPCYEDADGFRLSRPVTTPWVFVCTDCSDAFSFDEVEKSARDLGESLNNLMRQG